MSIGHRPPTPQRFYQLIDDARSAGLNAPTAEAYAAMGWWGEHYGIPAPRITSGARSNARNRQLQQRWDRGDRAGLSVRPADDTAHSTGDGFDLGGAPPYTLQVYGYWAPYVGLRWGGTFRDPDKIHFDRRAS